MGCGSSLVNKNHYWETKFASYFTIIYHDLHQNAIWESCLTIVIVHSQSQNRCFKEFANFLRKIPATKRPFAWGAGGWNAIWQNAVWTCNILVWGFPKYPKIGLVFRDCIKPSNNLAKFSQNWQGGSWKVSLTPIPHKESKVNNVECVCLTT